MKVVNFTIVKLSLCVAVGIASAHFFSIKQLLLLPLIAGTFFLLCLWRFTRKRLSPSFFFGLLTFSLFFGVGYVNYQLRLPSHQSKHFTHFSVPQNAQVLQLKIIEQLKSDVYNDKFLAKVHAVDMHKSEGNVLIYLEKKGRSKHIQIDDELLVSGRVQTIPKMLNPNQFDYKKYMQNQNVYCQIHLSESAIMQLATGSTTLRGYAEQMRNFAIKKLKETSIPINERAILQALLLGQKRDLSSTLKQKYADAGAIHLLAVSGLHVGIIFLIVNFLTLPINRLPFGQLIQPTLILGALWAFAFLTGLSPSVCRAVTMFSFLAIAQHFGRQTYTMNTLFLSFLFLLLIEPKWLFHVGFQLSYLAVFFIVWVQPKLAVFWRPKNLIVRLLWGIFTVSMAAQMGVLPLSLYYFHQIPGLFLVTNLAILPILGFILGFGLLVIILACSNLLPEWLSNSYTFILTQLNDFIRWVAAQEAFVIKDISFSVESTFISYLVIVAVILLWKRFSFHRVVFLLGSIWICIAVAYMEKVTNSSSALIVFQRSKKTMIGIKQETHMTLYTTDSSVSRSAYPIKNYLLDNQIEVFKEKVLPSVFRYENKSYLVLDSLGVFPEKKTVDYVLLTHSPKVNLNRLIDSLQPSFIIADGSNYHSYVKRWKISCKVANIPFHYTREQGAFVVKKNPN